MSIAYTDKNYIYAVSRIRFAELRLLKADTFERLSAASDMKECMSVLSEKGYDTASGDIDMVLTEERHRLWSLIGELIPDMSVFDVFRIQNDYDNLKAAIKESVLDHEMKDIYTREAGLDPMLVRRAVMERNYRLLPDDMAREAEICHDIFLRTGDGQLCDVILDRAALKAMQKAAASTKEQVLGDYAELRAASADIKIAIRAADTGKDRDFISRALAECSLIDTDSIEKAALSGRDAIYAYLANTDLSDAVPELKSSPAAFERWCDDMIIRKVRSQLWNSFGLGPVAAYIIAKETEIKSVRILLTAKQNGFPMEMIRERMRETYV